MSYDSTRNGYRGNHHNSDLPLTNGIALNNELVGKSHSSAPFMDGTTQLESRTAQINLGQFDDDTPHSRPVSAVYTPPVSSRKHHRTHSDSDDVIGKYPGVRSYGHSVIGPSASISEHLGSARQSRRDVYATTEAVDGGSMSRHYDVTTDESDRRMKQTPRQQQQPPNTVKLLTYKASFVEDALAEVASEDYNERFVGETDMTLSQQETASDIDAKITEMVRKRKISQGTSGRTPKTTVLPTKESMKEIMNMPPERKKRSSRSEVKRLERKTVHGVPWETERPIPERNEERLLERDSSQLKKKVEKKRQKVAKTESAVQLVGYRKKEDFGTTPSIPEEVEMPPVIRQSASQNFAHPPSNPVLAPRPGSARFGTEDTVSVSSTFEFRSTFSPPPPPPHSTSKQQRAPLSPTRDLVVEMKSETSTSVPPGISSSTEVGGSGGCGDLERDVGPSPSVFEPAEGHTVYRPNLQDTHLSDVAVFGKHFDPSQLTQERMEANVGDLSSVGLNVPSPLKKKKKESEKKAREKLGAVGNDDNTSAFLSEGLNWKDKSNFRSKSASVSPKRTGDKSENDPILRKGRMSSLKSRDSGDDHHEKLASWEMEISAHASRHSSILSTPSRYRMGRMQVHSFHEPVTKDVMFGGDDITKGSMPDIFRPSNPPGHLPTSPHRHSLRGVKEGTPESGTSDEEKPRKKRSIGYSLGRKLSTSMRELFAKDKKSPTSRTTWHFETSGGGGLYPAPSEPQLSALTENERREILEETEKVPRTQSTELILSSSHQQSSRGTSPPRSRENPLAHLFVPPGGADMATNSKQSTPMGLFEERSVDGYTEEPSSKKRLKSRTSDDEYETASESEEGYVEKAVNIITPSESENQANLSEHLPPSSSHQQLLPSSTESDPIMKSLDGIVDKKPVKAQKDAKSSKGLRDSGSKKEDPKKEKKLFSRFSKQRTVVQRRTPSPRPGSPSDSISSSRQSSGRFSPSRKPSNASSTGSSILKFQPPNNNADSAARRGSKTGSVASSGSPSGSFRGPGGGRSSPFSPPVGGGGGGRGSPRGSLRGVDGQNSSLAPSGRGSPRGSFRGGAVSPLRGSLRSSAASPTTPGGLNSARGTGFQRGVTGSPKPGEGLNSPRGSFHRGVGGQGSPRGSTRSLQASPSQGHGSPSTKSPSPRSSVHVVGGGGGSKLSPVATRKQQPSSVTKVKIRVGRRLSEPFVSPLSSSGSVTGLTKPKPVRQAPPPPPQQSSGNLRPLSRTVSQTSTTSTGSTASSPRQRKKGMSLNQSPLSPKKLPSLQVQSATVNQETTTEATTLAVGGGNDATTAKKGDDIETLMTSIGEKLAALPDTSSPVDTNPLDDQTEFEIPPPVGGEDHTPK